MRTFVCVCGNRLFFDNTQCLACHRQVGWCPRCAGIRALEREGDGRWRCTASDCGALLVPCHNNAVEGVCNAMVEAEAVISGKRPFCNACRFNHTVPDTSIAGNREKWAQIEAAKRRVLYTLDQLGLPYGTANEGFDPALRFEFKADLVRSKERWSQLGPIEPVYTGHASGRITINLDEADDAERERRRVHMNEAHRTLIGHFRHEIAHYFWDLLVRGRCEAAFCDHFGDHTDPPYREALKQYYAAGPPADWQRGYVSAYATMHPWEDFAETFALFMDMVAVLETAGHWEMESGIRPLDDLDATLRTYQRLGIRLNEINREMGLLDLVPEIFVPPVIDKLRFVHALIRYGAGIDDAPAAPSEEVRA